MSLNTNETESIGSTFIECESCRHVINVKEKCSEICTAPSSEPSSPVVLTDEVCTVKCTSCDKCVGFVNEGKFQSVSESLYADTLSQADGWKKVDSVGDRRKLFILSQIVYNEQEISFGNELEVQFAVPYKSDFVKLLWVNRSAVGFYSVKPKGTLCTETMQCYTMCTLDTIFIRKSHRRQGLASSALEDILTEFPQQNIGFSSPVSIPMRKVLRKHLVERPQNRPRFWEITGCPEQGNCRNLWLILHKTQESS